MIGAIVGKFYPYHLGHRHLIQTGVDNCDELYVYVCQRDWNIISGDIRAQWIKEDFPNIHVGVIDQDLYHLPDSDPIAWAKITEQMIGQKPDVVFTSEAYGDGWAKAIGCDHYLVDLDRLSQPISGTAIRQDPLRHLDWLPPQVRGFFTLRVAIIGAESTGKSTLANDLAKALGTSAVPEFGRNYTEAMPDPDLYPWEVEDFRIIARQQARLEDWWARHSGPILITDTTPFVTQVFCQAYLGHSDAEVEKIAADSKYDLVFLTDPDTPFIADGGRRPELRQDMHDMYLQYLLDHNMPWQLLTGAPNQRLAAALAKIEPLYDTWSQRFRQAQIQDIH